MAHGLSRRSMRLKCIYAMCSDILTIGNLYDLAASHTRSADLLLPRRPPEAGFVPGGLLFKVVHPLRWAISLASPLPRFDTEPLCPWPQLCRESRHPSSDLR